jgi:hypothetical protein
MKEYSYTSSPHLGLHGLLQGEQYLLPPPVMSIKIMDMTNCNLIDGYQSFKETYCIHLQDRSEPNRGNIIEGRLGRDRSYEQANRN